MTLPYSSSLPVEHLASAFQYTTNSYKFYWFLALLEKTKSGKQELDLDELVIEMLAEAWHPINQYRLSFGKLDKLNEKTIDIKGFIQGTEKKDFTKSNYVKQLTFLNQKDERVHKMIRELQEYVPYRFLNPWFTNELTGLDGNKRHRKTVELAEKNFEDEKPSLYRFIEKRKKIEINPDWLEYLSKQFSILKGFTYWRLINYLEKHNPNVPNIPAKLFPPQERKLQKARSFWDVFLQYSEIHCIYSQKKVSKSKYSLDHFLPWSFVGHDQTWNLVPTMIEMNSSKGNNLPSLKRYLDSFTHYQYQAFHQVIQVNSKLKAFDDYTVLFNKTLEEIQSLSEKKFKEGLNNSIKPQFQIALNMGFPEKQEFTKD